MSARLAWLAPALTFIFVAVMVPLSWETEGYEGAEVLFGLAFLSYAAVGALIAARQPRNPLGWLFCAVGVVFAGSEMLYAYAMNPAHPSGSAVAAWLSAWLGSPSAVTIVLILLLFPTGRFLSQAWRVVGIVAMVVAVVWAVSAALDPGPLRNADAIENPVGVSAANGLLESAADVAGTTFWVLALLAVVSVVVRFRRARAQERRQIKVLAVAACFAVGAIVVGISLDVVLDTDEGVGDTLSALMVAGAISSFPVAAGIAVLRHRLYDIDVVIKRTLVYGSLTTTLVATYLVLVLLFQFLLRPLAGDSDLAVAASTLAVAALFKPLRARIKAGVDRRFYRERYDASRTLEAFSARLRDELDLEALGDDLRRVVRDTMQPAHVTLWLRSSEASR